MIYILLWASIFQFAAAVLALRLIRISERRLAWGLIAVAMALMTVRRALPLYRLLFHDAPMPLDLANEMVGLALSFLMMLGVASMAPLFAAFKRAGAAAQESEMKFRTIANFTADWQYWISTEGRFIYTTPSCEKITGYRYDEFITTPSLLDTIVHPEDYAVIEQHRQLLTSTAAHAADFRIVTRGCEVRWIAHTCQPVFDDNGTLLGRCASNRDITGRKHAEEALRRSEEKFRSIVDASPVAMHFYRLESDGRLVLTGANPAADRILGMAHQALAGKTIEEAFPLLGNTQVPMTYRRVARGELGAQSFELPYHDRRFGGIYDLTVFQTGPGHVTAAFVDISDRKRAEEELARHQDHLEEIVRQRTAELQAKNAQLAAEVAVRTQTEDDIRKKTGELETFNRTMVGRETRVIELKEEVNRLCAELKRAQAYPPVWQNGGRG